MGGMRPSSVRSLTGGTHLVPESRSIHGDVRHGTASSALSERPLGASWTDQDIWSRLVAACAGRSRPATALVNVPLSAGGEKLQYKCSPALFILVRCSL